MATDAKKHTTIAAGENPSRAAIAASLLSLSDVVPVASATEQAQIGTALAATAFPVSTSRPLATTRADARALHQLEVSRDGATFVPTSGVMSFANDAARDTWTAANSGLLSVGDHCISAGFDGVWTGTAWIQDTDYANTPITLAGTFVHYASAPWNGLRIARRGRCVYLSGPVQNTAAWAAGAQIGTLAAGYRPAVAVPGLAGLPGNIYSELTIASTGIVTVNTAGNANNTIMIQATFLV